MKVSREVSEQIRRYIDDHRNEMICFWEKLVNMDSGPDADEGVNQVVRFLGDELEKAGMRVRYVSSNGAGDMLVAESKSGNGKAPMLFTGHMDTVFKKGTAEKNPFRIDEDGYAHGPGVLDMKGGLTAAVFAVKALMDAGFSERPLKCVFAPDEEVLHSHSDVKELMGKEAEGALAAFNFETGFIDDTFVVGRKGGGPVSLKVHGVAAHSGNAPEKGRSAILEAANKIVELESKNDIERGKLINCGRIQGGIGANTIPGECSVDIAIRYPDSQIREEILEDLKHAADHNTVSDTWAELDTRNIVLNMETTEGVKALMQHISDTAEEIGYGETGSRVVGGLSDSGIMVAAGVPTVCGMGVQGEGNHTPDEYAVVESLFRRCWLAACAVYSLEEDFIDRYHNA